MVQNWTEHIWIEFLQINLSGKRKGLKGNDKAGHNGSSTSRNTSWENLRSTQLNDIQLQNARLAKELNAFKVAKATLTDRIHTLNSEILELKVQNATQRDEMKRQQVRVSNYFNIVNTRHKSMFNIWL